LSSPRMALTLRVACFTIASHTLHLMYLTSVAGEAAVAVSAVSKKQTGHSAVWLHGHRQVL
jgi:hypothetical protein